MLTYSFENIGKTSLYEHLYNCIKNDIMTGQLKNGCRLPSKRSFAKNLGISSITVENAYAQLMAEGYIYSLPKKGYYVSDISQMLTMPVSAARAAFSNNSGQTFSNYAVNPSDALGGSSDNFYASNSASKRTSGNTFKNTSGNAFKNTSGNASCAKPAYFADLTSNYTNKDNFPFYTWSKLMKEVIADSASDLLTTSPAAGIYPLREAISRHLIAFRGMQVSPEQIIIGAGTEYLYSLLIQLLGREKTFAVEDPGYRKIRLIYESNNVNCVSLPMTNEGIDTAALVESCADIIHISPSHHYPTGIVTPITRRYELLGWASQSDNRYIIEDDYDSEFRLFGKPIPSLQSIDISGKVIYINTFTKTLTPTIRISYMVLPKPLLELFNEKLSFYSCTVSNFEQYTLARFIEYGHFEKHINRMRIFYKKQRNSLIDAINSSELSKLVKIHEADSGLHFLLEVKTRLSDEELIKKAHKNGLKIVCLSQYYHNADNAVAHTLIVNYSGIAPDSIGDTIARLCRTLA